MLDHRLRHHRDTPPDAALVLAADASRHAGVISLRYRLTGDIDRVLLPVQSRPERKDELWRTTCFEAFLRTRRARSYVEVNLSPSSAWAAYSFSSYRKGMTPIEAVALIPIDTTRRSGAIELSARLDLKTLLGASAGDPLRIGLSAVIEEKGGRKSYWALRHAPGRPDFHNAHCFSLEVAGDAAP